MDYTGCGECGKPQWGCDCWLDEAATFTPGAQQGEDRLYELRREAYPDNPERW